MRDYDNILEQNNMESSVRQAILDAIKAKKYPLSKVRCCRGKASGKGVDESGKYKLYVMDDAYCISRDIDLDAVESIDLDTLQKWAIEKDIVLNKEEYSCHLLDNNVECISSPKRPFEVCVKVDDICIQFTSDSGETVLFFAENNPENTEPLSAFFSMIGIKNYSNIIDIPEDTFPISVDRGNLFLGDGSTYLVFRQNGELIFLRPDSENTGYVNITEVGINEINFYKQEGSLRYEQSISGSGGAKNSYGGAIVGGLLFGTAGAMIGSRKNEAPVNISSTTIEHDSRVVILSIRRNKRSFNICFPMVAEGIFDWLIPEKQYDYVISERRRAFEQEDRQYFGNNGQEDTKKNTRLFTVKKKELPEDRTEVSDEPESVVPIYLFAGMVKCPICGTNQKSDRTKCQTCMITFRR